MNCPNCNTSLDADTDVCFACGQEITDEIRKHSKGKKDKEFDEVIQNLIMTDESEQIEDEVQARQEQRKQQNRLLQIQAKQYRLASFLTLGVVLLFVVSLFLGWFTVKGTVAFQGYFYTEKTASYLLDGAKLYSKDNLTNRAESVAKFSPMQFLTYAKEYESHTQKHGLLTRLQVYYAKGIYLLYFLVVLCILVLVFDKKGKFVEVIRVSSILSVIFVLLNTLAMKLPYINLIVLNAKALLAQNGVSSRVISKGLMILDKTKQELSYQVDFGWGWMVSVALVALWFVMATVLTEMSRTQKEKRS